MRLKDKVAVITGAGSGMGRAMSEMFSSEGAKVVCADVSGKQEQVASAIGDAAVAVHTDVSLESDIERMIRTAEDRFGRLDILVNNAGIGGDFLPLHEQAVESWDRIHAVNLRGVFFGMKYGIASMLETGGGAIVNIASTAAIAGLKDFSPYATAKAGVVQMTKCASLDYGTNNIRVNAICPGSIWTGLVKQAEGHPEPPPDFPIPAGIPLNRWGLARDIAAAALFLVSDEASFITGASLPVDGGYVAGCSGAGAGDGR